MALKTLNTLLLLLLIFTVQIIAQDCLEYSEIGGSECVGCVPNGWTPTSGTTPDIIPDDGTWPGGGCMINELSGESPGGGNMSFFASANSAYQEGMSTTVSGLNTNQEYGFGLYWEQVTASGCGVFEAGDLTITVDGETYDYEDAEDWELIEICFTPSQSSIDIEISISSESMNVIVVDSPDCDDITPCCPLVLILEEEEYEICPGEEFLIEGDIDNPEGDVVIEWTSEPSGGVDFLDAVDILNPTFSFPEDENFEGEIYTLTVTVEDDNCVKEQSIIVTVNPSEVPEFEIIICELDFIDILPIESLNGYTGTWAGDFDFEDLVGTVQEYTFTLDADQNNCIEEYTYQIPINPAVEATFIYQNRFCVLDDEDYEFPEESEEDIEGEWIEDDFRPSDLGVGVFIFEFVPEPEFCAFPYFAEIEVYEESELSFEIPDTFCVTNQNYVLPNPSLENIFGSWDVFEIDLSEATTQSVTFTPEDVNDCFKEYDHTYTVIESIATSFNIPDTICKTQGAIVFDSISLEGTKGFWTPLSVDPDTVLGSEFDIFWTPFDITNNCIEPISLTIIVEAPRNVDLDLPEVLCENEEVLILPSLDSNGPLNGSWNISQIDPSMFQGSMVDLLFTPDQEFCTNPYIHSIEVVDLQEPVFDFQTEFCSTNNALILPTIDNNGIEGIWSTPIIQPDMINGEITSVFTPTDIAACVNNYESTFIINNLIIPQFDLPTVFCPNDEEYIFEELSLNNIQGNWTEFSFDPNNVNGDMFTNTFTPLDLSCNDILDINIPIINFNEIQYNVSNSSSCSASDGSVVFTNANNFEFSTDNGLTWQYTPTIDDLSAGNYQIMVRSILHTICIDVYDIQISAPSAPTIFMLEVSDISNCGESDGMLICEAEGEILEYSIDNGTTWQQNNIFLNLGIGDYIILVRSDGDSNCSAQESFRINDIEDVSILDVVTINISDCGLSDGQVIVLPNDVIYEYSIDGIDWQVINVFDNLGQGEYSVAMRLIESPNCIDETSTEIESVQAPQIISIDSFNPSDCGIENGTISIEADGIEVEYSLDDGLSWSSNNTFSNLNSGIYTILIREVNAPNCIDESSITLESPNTPEIVDFNISQPTDCILNDGFIEIITETSDVEFSINNGVDWQNQNTFEGLEPNNYEVIIRNINSPECTILLPFTIMNIPCPCNNLDIEIFTSDINCFEDNSGLINITDINGFYTNEDFTILWSNGSNELSLQNLTTGWYQYEIMYDKNCTLVDSVFLDAFDPINFGLLSFDPNCKEGGSIEVTDIEGGDGQFEFSLDGINFQEDNVFFDLTANDYAVLIQDMFGCEATQNITLNNNQDLTVDLPIIQPINSGETITLNPLINQTTIDSFEWSPSIGIIDPNSLIAEVSPSETTEYTLTIYFGDCVETRTVTVEVIENTNIYLGNTFSPNQDGNNDYFYIQSSLQNGISVEDFKIYDRWGNLVFNKSNPEINNKSDGWDGTRNGNALSHGVYTYIIIYTKNETQEILSGHLTLIR